jgi:hypothetical protein
MWRQLQDKVSRKNVEVNKSSDERTLREAEQGFAL